MGDSKGLNGTGPLLPKLAMVALIAGLVSFILSEPAVSSMLGIDASYTSNFPRQVHQILEIISFPLIFIGATALLFASAHRYVRSIDEDSEDGPWWAYLFFFGLSDDDRTVVCPTSSCGEENDLVAVVCEVDRSPLPGTEISDDVRWALRLGAIGAAIAAGYWLTPWPAFGFGMVLLFGLYSLFVRRYLTAWKFFLAAGAVALVLQVSLRILIPGLGEGIMIVGLAAFILFVAPIYGVLNGMAWGVDESVLWTSFMISLSLIALAAFFACSMLIEGSQIQPLKAVMLRVAILSAGIAATTTLVTGTSRGIKRERRAPDDLLGYQEILKEKSFQRIEFPDIDKNSLWIEKLIGGIWSMVEISSNLIIASLEDAYNQIIVRILNGTVESIVKAMNSIWREIAIAVQYLVFVLTESLEFFRNALSLTVNFSIFYILYTLLPLLLWWFASSLIYGMSEAFTAYIHDGPLWLPLQISLEGILAIVVLGLGIGLYMKINLAELLPHVGRALVYYGTYALLFFILTAWLLGISGGLIGGPFRVGWVTLLSTGLVVSIYIIALLRSRQQNNPNAI